MKPPYYVFEDSKCLAYIEEMSYFIFWRRWYWNASFYNEDDWLPCDSFDGYSKSEAQAKDNVNQLYNEMLVND